MPRIDRGVEEACLPREAHDSATASALYSIKGAETEAERVDSARGGHVCLLQAYSISCVIAWYVTRRADTVGAVAETSI